MKLTIFQHGEIRDENDKIIQEGTYGKHTVFTSSDNRGILDYIINNFEVLFQAVQGNLSGIVDVNAILDTVKEYINKQKYVQSVDGKGLSTNDYTTDEKDKLAGLENYSLTMDKIKTALGYMPVNETALNDKVSTDVLTNAITSVANNFNQTLAGYAQESELNDKQDKLVFDSAPTENSKKMLTSGAIYAAIQKAVQSISDVDNTSF
nr:MAG TPA: hypothetical protein [Caudoviricetes sp.]